MRIISSTARNRALTLVELLVVVAVLVALAIFFLSVPDRNVKARALRIQCVNNLKQTGLAFDVWSKDHGEKFPMEIPQTNGGTMEFASGANEWRHFEVMSNELRTPRVLYCPAEESRWPATNFVWLGNSNISFFIALDFSHPNPSAIWSGDRNLTNGAPIHNGILEFTTNQPVAWTAEMHKRVGNLLLFDGSVQQADQAGLRNTIANSGALTNRLQLPILGP